MIDENHGILRKSLLKWANDSHGGHEEIGIVIFEL